MANSRTLLLPIAVIVLGVSASLYGGYTLEQQARANWKIKAQREAERMTSTTTSWISTLERDLRGMAALFHASERVTEDELLDAVDILAEGESAVPLITVAHVIPVDGDFVVDVATDQVGPLALGERISKLPLTIETVNRSIDVPEHVAYSPVLGQDFGAPQILLSVSVPHDDDTAAILTLLDVTSLLEGLNALQIPSGFSLRLTESSLADPEQRRLVGTAGRVGEVSEVTEVMVDLGSTIWWFEWSVHETYDGGPATVLAKVVTAGGTVVVMLFGFVMINLSRQNAMINRRVDERTVELEAARNEALRSAELAEAANRAKSAFLANISHEIRTPLNAIQGFAEILDQRIEDPQQHEYLKSIESSSNSLLELINDILDLARSEDGSLVLTIGDVSNLKVFNDLEISFAQKAEKKGINFTLDLDPGLPRMIRLDEKRLYQVMSNLVDNAIKFTDSGRVNVSARAADSAGRPGTVDLSFDVQDTGSGIPDDEIEHIFGAFNQRKGQSINEYGGTGLGLALVHQLVGMMGGHVNVQSEPGVGSTFQVVIEGVEVVSSADLGDIESNLEQSGGMVETVEAWSPANLTDDARARLPLLVDFMKSQVETCGDLSFTLTLNEIDAFAQTMIEHGDSHDYPPLRAWATRLARQSDAFDMDGVAESLKIYSQLVDATAALTS